MSKCCIGNFPCCIGNCCIFVSSSGRSSCCVKHGDARDTANEIAQMQFAAREDWSKEEEKISDELSSVMKDLIDYLEKLNKYEYGSEGNKKSLSINIGLLRDKLDDIRRSVRGFMTDRISERLVQTDPECSAILSEKDDDARQKNFDEFKKRLESEARDALCKKVTALVGEMQTLIRSTLTSRIEEARAEMRKSEAELNSIIEQKRTNSPALLGKKVTAMYDRTVCDLIRDNLRSA